jgi:tRNA (guanosine-2'-O-)-methyltransferase
MTTARQKKIKQVMAKRQNDLHVIIENVDDPHNIGAILRSCDAFGVGEVHLLYTKNKPPRMQELRTKAAASAVKWLKITKWTSLTALTRYLKKQKIKIATTGLTEKSIDVRTLDCTQPIAFVLGNEHEGVSSRMLKAAHLNVTIPMIGFIQSFNVSVAGALLLYEAFRQRES